MIIFGLGSTLNSIFNENAAICNVTLRPLQSWSIYLSELNKKDGCVKRCARGKWMHKPLWLYNFDNASSYISTHTLWPWDAAYDACPHAHDYITLFINQPFMQMHQENKAFSFLWLLYLYYNSKYICCIESVMIF